MNTNKREQEIMDMFDQVDAYIKEYGSDDDDSDEYDSDEEEIFYDCIEFRSYKQILWYMLGLEQIEGWE